MAAFYRDVVRLDSTREEPGHSVWFSLGALERAGLREALSYAIDPRANRVKAARFSLPEAVAPLRGFDVLIEWSRVGGPRTCAGSTSSEERDLKDGGSVPALFAEGAQRAASR